MRLHATAKQSDEPFLPSGEPMDTLCSTSNRALADLLGFDEWLGDLTKGASHVSTWLSRYRPIDDGPDAA